jgi:hypothetical protein
VMHMINLKCSIKRPTTPWELRLLTVIKQSRNCMLMPNMLANSTSKRKKVWILITKQLRETILSKWPLSTKHTLSE